MLDQLANRNLSQGTNAWTDTDHTCYTLETAGEEGFLNLLPVYIDHILYPTITESAFITEVHHITQEGKNAGNKFNFSTIFSFFILLFLLSHLLLKSFY